MFIKDIFDFLRNLLIAVAILVASFFVEFHGQNGIGRELIYSERFYEDRSRYLTAPYEIYLETRIEEELELYLRGFKQGGSRLIDRMSPSEYAELQTALQRLELLRYERYKDSDYHRWLMNSLFTAPFLLALLNAGWIAGRFPAVPMIKLDHSLRIVTFALTAYLSTAALIAVLDIRRTELFSESVSRDDLITFSRSVLGQNEYHSFGRDHLTSLSLDMLRWQ